MNATSAGLLVALAASAIPAASHAQTTSTPSAAPDTVCAKPAFRRFDYWVGDWVVKDSAGKVLGTNSVTRDVGGCGLHEHWVSENGSIGESFTALSSNDGKWHQLYVGSGGYIVAMNGGFEGERLVMNVAPRPSARDPKMQVMERWTWTPMDATHVRQTAAVSSDGGTTWKTIFDGIYERAAR